MISRDTLLCISPASHPGNLGTRFHNYLYDELGLSYLYKAFATKDIEAMVKGVRILGIRGCAVSIPFKESYILSLNMIDPSVKVTDSINTIISDDEKSAGLNIDYIAVRGLIASHRLGTNARMMIQGSGGMGKAAIAAFRDTSFCGVIIAAHNRQRGLTLTKQYGFQRQPLPEGIAAEILVNVTPLGAVGGTESNTLAFSKAMVARTDVVFDVVALPAGTPLIRSAQRWGEQTISGAKVIALQAVKQFAFYIDIWPDNALVVEASAFVGSQDAPPGKVLATSWEGYLARKEVAQTEK